MNRLARGALSGAAAATVWTLAEPVLMRTFGTPYSDVRLAGRIVTRGRLWPLAGAAAHAAIGGAIGAAFGAAGLTTSRLALVGAQAENLATWPGMVLVDRYHPDRRDGRWPRLVTNPRVFAQSAAARALFAVVYAQSFERLA